MYMYKDDLALDKLQWLIRHKTKQKKSYISNISIKRTWH